MGSIARTSCDNAIPLKETCHLCDKPVIAIILNFIIIFKVYPKLPESRRKTLKTQVKLIRAQNLPSLWLLSTNIVLSTLLIQGSMQDACHMNFVTDLAHRGVSVAQWLSIGARNPKVWDSIPHGNWEFFFVPRSWQDEKKTFSNEKDVCVLSRARVKETILSSREESNLRPSDSALRCSITEPQRLYSEQSLLRSSYDARSVYCLDQQCR